MAETLVKKQIKTRVKQSGIIAIDNGGEYTKVLTDSFKTPKVITSTKSFGSDGHFSRNIKEGDFDVVYDGQRYFFGSLVRHAPDDLITGLGQTKDHIFFIISTLLAIHQYGYDINYVSLSTPLKEYLEEDNEQLEQKLVGTHTLEVNGETKTFEIMAIEVAPEALVAFYNQKPTGKVRWIDFGSRTVNTGTTYFEEGWEDPDFFEDEQGTIIDKGLSLEKGVNYNKYVLTVQNYLGKKKWKNDDRIKIIGGGGEIQELVDAFTSLYPNAEVITDPQIEQVKGLYEFAKAIYQESM